jgi:hypothetical protein
MVIMSNTIQSGWDFDQDDSIIDNLSTGTTSSFKRSEIPMKNDGELLKLCKKLTKTTNNYSTHTDEEGRTTTSPGQKKPKK